MSRDCNHTILASARVVGLATLASRLLGLVRDMATTAVLGPAARDALLLAWTIPNLLRRLFGEGALSSALVPAFARVKEGHGLPSALAVGRGVVSRLSLFLTGVLVLLMAATFAVPRAWLDLLFESPAKAALCLTLLRVFLPYLVLVCVLAQLSGVLNCLGRFFVPAAAPALLNLIWIAAAVAVGLWPGLSSERRAIWIAAAILMGGGLQLAAAMIDLRRFGRWPRPGARETIEVRGIFLSMTPLLVGLAASQVNVLVDRLVAEGMVPGDGAVTHLYLGLRMMQFPLGLVSIAISTAAFPQFARLAARGDRAGLAGALFGSMRSGLFLALPAALGLFVLSRPIMELLFVRGEFTLANAGISARALAAYAAGIPFFTVSMLLIRAHYSLGRYRVAVVTTVISVAFNITADLVLVRWMQETGIALATSAAALLQTVLLLRWFSGAEDRAAARRCVRDTLGTLVAGLAMAAVVWAMLWLVGGGEPEEGRRLSLLATRMIRVVVPVGAGLAVFAVAARRLAPRTWHEVAGLVRRRTRRAPEVERNST